MATTSESPTDQPEDTLPITWSSICLGNLRGDTINILTFESNPTWIAQVAEIPCSACEDVQNLLWSHHGFAVVRPRWCVAAVRMCNEAITIDIRWLEWWWWWWPRYDSEEGRRGLHSHARSPSTQTQLPLFLPDEALFSEDEARQFRALSPYDKACQTLEYILCNFLRSRGHLDDNLTHYQWLEHLS